MWAVLAIAAISLQPDRVLERAGDGEVASGLEALADCARGWQLELDGIAVTTDALLRWAEAARRGAERGSLTRALREEMGRPVDPEDLLLFLDDACQATGERRQPWVVTAGRARAHGIFVHPSEIYSGETRRYGEAGKPLNLEPPLDYRTLQAPPDGAPVGPSWAARYLEPEHDSQKLAALRAARPGFGRRITELVEQLRAAGAQVRVESAVRSRERGYLLFGSFWLGRASSDAQAEHRIERLQAYNREWRLNVPITWRHPEGLAASVAQAQRLSDTYGVVYATIRGARRSRHYGGRAVDLSVVDLPRRLQLTGTDGVRGTFDLSDPDQTRDLSLSPEVVAWVEQHFQLRKLRADYPHWSDPLREGVQ